MASAAFPDDSAVCLALNARRSGLGPSCGIADEKLCLISVVVNDPIDGADGANGANGGAATDG